MAWQNDDLLLYHGCTSYSLRPQRPDGIAVGALPHGISPFLGADKPDFGKGFYATTWLDQAMGWANTRRRALRRIPGVHAVVLEFRVRRNDLANLETLTFVTEKSGYFPFVRYCRRGGRLHAAATQRPAPYDVVFGPVSLGRQPFVIQGCDQVSFHTESAVAAISEVKITATGAPNFRLAL